MNARIYTRDDPLACQDLTDPVAEPVQQRIQIRTNASAAKTCMPVQTMRTTA